MQNYIMGFDADSADGRFDEMPEVGSQIVTDMFGESIITGIDIINERKMILKVVPKKEVKRYERMDSSLQWEKLPDRFLESTVDELPDSSFKNY